MTDMTLTRDDREAIEGILLAQREQGDPRPLLPADVDLDGDGGPGDATAHAEPFRRANHHRHHRMGGEVRD